jgi:aminoglycoside phosphotransferase (APT) family kinase protein
MPMPPWRHVEINRDTVVKTSLPELMRVEVEKTIQARKIGEASGLFRVPRVLEYTPGSASAVFERIHAIQPVRESLAFSEDSSAVISRVAQALAVCHQNLRLPQDMVRRLPEALQASGDTKVFLHGDFNTDNVFLSLPDRQLVILDWQTTAACGEQVTYGTRLFDVLWFIKSLFHRPLRLRYWRARNSAVLASAFLKIYLTAADIPETPQFKDVASAYATRFCDTVILWQRHDRSWWKNTLAAGQYRGLRHFIANLFE